MLHIALLEERREYDGPRAKRESVFRQELHHPATKLHPTTCFRQPSTLKDHSLHQSTLFLSIKTFKFCASILEPRRVLLAKGSDCAMGSHSGNYSSPPQQAVFKGLLFDFDGTLGFVNVLSVIFYPHLPPFTARLIPENASLLTTTIPILSKQIEDHN